MMLTNFTQKLLENGAIQWREVAEEWMIMMTGWLMAVTALIGLLVNFKVFIGYQSKQMSSFTLMCSSKTLSNSLICCGYLFYNAPISILNNFTEATLANMLTNHSVSYSFYILGPATQFLITINRFLVIFFAAKSRNENHQKMTLIALLLCWLAAFAITIIGTEDDCMVIFVPELLNWWSGGCDDNLGNAVMEFAILCAILSNVCNLIVLIKLLTNTKKGIMDSVSTRRRRQRSQKLFLQNCIQDWIFAIDSVNSTWLDNLWKNVVYSFFFNIYSNLSVHVIDGLVMLFFNYEKKPKKLQALTAKKSETSHFTGNTTGSIVRI